MLLLEEGSIDARCRAAGITGSGRLEGIMNELVDLWSRRALVLQPV